MTGGAVTTAAGMTDPSSARHGASAAAAVCCSSGGRSPRPAGAAAAGYRAIDDVRDLAAQQAERADVLVDLRPMDAGAPAHEAPIRALLPGTFEQTGEPGDRCTDGPAIHQGERDGVSGQRDISNADTRISRNSRATLARKSLHGPPPITR